MSRLSFLNRRPSASMCVALVALFLALGGVGWAATQLPAGSVNTTQLRDRAVTAPKLGQAAVGTTQIDSGAVQRRVQGGCPSTSAIASISRIGSVGCNWTLPRESGAASNRTAIDTAGVTVVKLTLPARSAYIVIANPDLVVAGTVPGQPVTVTCSLSVGDVTQTRAAMVEVGPTHQRLETALSLVVSNPSAPKGQVGVKLACHDAFGPGDAPTVGVTAGVSALQIRGS